ncbi:sugar phosphate isomerase/epimerase [Flavobacteriaceae bacterium]|nr:sugar phosphate isomerase/epimerase [Flavobacteriaceae bacterium]
MKAKNQNFSRRSFLGKTATVAAGLSLTGSSLFGAPAYIPNLLNPNSTINGVRLGVITYSFRAMKDQSAEAILQYVLDSGISEIELMGSTAESFNGRPENKMDRRKFYSLMRKERNNKLSEEDAKELEDLKFQSTSFEKEVEKWNMTRSLDGFTKLKKMYNDAGVNIYAFKPDYLLNEKNSDSDINYAMQAGKILGASHVTLELPKNSAHTLRLGQLAEKNGIYVAYHGHEQQHPTWWDTALKQSPHNVMNLDLGHYTAAGNTDSIELIQNKSQNILSMHVKDRQNPENGKKNVSFGNGDTPIKEVLKLMRDNKYKFAATIEYEYDTPEDSSIIEEIKKSVAYCKDALES